MDASNYESPSVERLYDKYANMLFRLAYSITASKEEAEDILQIVFVRYMTKQPCWQEEEHEKAWLMRVTINQARDSLRKSHTHAYTPLEEMIHITAPTQETPYLLQEVIALPEKYKTVVLLHYFEDVKVNEIAKILKVSSSAVKMRLARARDLLKLKLEKENTYV